GSGGGETGRIPTRGGPMNTTDAAAFWDGVHAARPAAADPRPNLRLTETATGLPPGRALDLGCGAGGDVLWLARRGWRVTAVDVSAVAVRRIAALVLEYGLADLVSVERHDLAASLPRGRFD